MRNSAKIILPVLAMLPGSLAAQDIPAFNTHQPIRMTDENGFDLLSGALKFNKKLVSFGDPGNPLTVAVNTTSPSDSAYQISTMPTDMAYQTGNGYVEVTSAPFGSAVFRPNSYYDSHPGSFLWSIGPSVASMSTVTGYTDAEGNSARLPTTPYGGYDIYFATGEHWSYYFSTQGLKFITSNRGYGVQFSYNSSGLSRVTFYNKAFVYCDESQLLDCPSVSSLDSAATVGWGTQGTYSTVTFNPPDEASLELTLNNANDTVSSFVDVVAARTPQVANSNRTYTYQHIPGDGNGRGAQNSVVTGSNSLGTWTYYGGGYVDYGGDPFAIRGASATDPSGNSISVDFKNFLGTPVTLWDRAGQQWSYTVDANLRPNGQIFPEGNRITYTRDDRGNVIEERQVAKAGSGLADIVRTANYPATCTTTTLLTCNKPNWARDAKNGQTDFTYNSGNGAPLTKTGPADVNGVRPQTRYTYVQRYAWILNGSGGYGHAAEPIWLLATESFCRASAATGNASSPCAANDEVKTTYEYGPDSGPNNLFLRGIVVSADGTSLRTCYGNDRNGRRISTTTPRGTAGLTSCP